MDENENVRLRWSNDQIKCFLELCIEEVNKVGRKGMSLQKESWAKLQTKLLEICGMKVTPKQMKNQFDYMKGKYTGWVYFSDELFSMSDQTEIPVGNENPQEVEDNQEVQTHGSASDQQFMINLSEEIAGQMMQNEE